MEYLEVSAVSKRRRAEAYLELAKKCRLQYQYQTSIQYYEKALEIAKQREDKQQVTMAYIGIGDSYRLQKQYQKSIEYYEKALEIAKERGDKLQVTMAYLGIRHSYRSENQYPASLEYYEKALEIAKERGDKQQATRACLGIGHPYRLENQYQTSIECYEKTLEIAKERGDKQQATRAYLGMGDSYALENLYQTSIEYYEKALEIAKERGDKRQVTEAYLRIGDSYRSENHYQTSIEYYEKALEIAVEQGDEWQVTEAYLEIGHSYRLENQHQMSIEYYEKALKVAKERGDKYKQQVTDAEKYLTKAVMLSEMTKFIKVDELLLSDEESNDIVSRFSTTTDSQELWKWKENSKVHREKFKKLLEFRTQKPNAVKEINGVRVCCSKDFLIDKGADGTRVYVGLGKDGIERAVKRLPKDVCTSVAEQEMKILTQLNRTHSSNVVKYWFLDESSDEENLFLILDLCEETLKTYVDRESRDNLAIIAPEIIRQILEGIADLHRGPNPILHRDLKPSNILRDVNGKWLLADFGISRVMETDGTTHESEQRGTKHWRAVETYQSKDTPNDCQVRYKKQSDIQVVGMVTYYIVTKGEHPFGEERDLLNNLLDGKPVGLEKLKDPALKDLLAWMLSHDPKDRPSAEEAFKHPYLQLQEQQFELLCNMGNQPEIKNRDVSSIVVQQLNSDSTDWRTLINAGVLKYLSNGFSNGKPKTFKYASSWSECLRLIRNVNLHWKDRPRPKPQPEPFYLVGDPQEYFLKIFPCLPVAVHRAVRSCDWKERPELQKYFK